MKLLLFFALLSFSSSQDLSPTFPNRHPVKRSYVCPPKFIRQGHRCYYFSKHPLSWNEALFQCRDMHSNLAVVQNRNQDKLIKSFLSKKTLDPLERWLGGVYDWRKMAWKWAASGKPLAFNGFPKEVSPKDPESLRWHCIIVDPALQFMWSSRSCVEQKHFICQTRLKTVNNREKKKLKRQYKADKDNKLNEIPVPLINDSTNNVTSLKYNIPITYHFEVNENLNDKTMFAYKSPELSKNSRRVNPHRNKKRNPQRIRQIRLANGTIAEVPSRRLNRNKQNKKTKNMGKPTLMKNIRWKTYYKKEKLPNPLYPQPIVEEYNYVRDG
ncbi:unnamed protein product [Psylliodes chrysocephalus]|uniref:C-type lectin domain-containing protein n=1 Tax=Psylliodes chrysocephalus TaxID=3402493 RepID=A0A9P0CM77_9CUCU|nr:unnamed protein product [Psylliodes chrysocephala]